MSNVPWSITTWRPPLGPVPAPGGGLLDSFEGSTFGWPFVSLDDSAIIDSELEPAKRSLREGASTGAELLGVPGGMGSGAPTTGLVASAIVAQAQSNSAPRRARMPLLKTSLCANPARPYPGVTRKLAILAVTGQANSDSGTGASAFH